MSRQRETVPGPLSSSLAPAWAVLLAREVLTQARWSEQRIEALRLGWRVSRAPWERMTWKERGLVSGDPERAAKLQRRPTRSSGVAYPGSDRLVVTAGSELVDQRLVLLHELAHLLVGPGHHHDRTFWRRAWGLYLADGQVSVAYALHREGAYREMALRVAVTLGLPGAAVSLAARRRLARERISMTIDSLDELVAFVQLVNS